MIIEFGVQRQRREGMKGYEGCYDCEYETQEEGAGKHSKKITNREEEGAGVEGVSCTHLAIAGDGTRRQIDTKRFAHMKKQTNCYGTKRSQWHNYDRSKYECYRC